MPLENNTRFQPQDLNSGSFPSVYFKKLSNLIRNHNSSKNYTFDMRSFASPYYFHAYVGDAEYGKGIFSNKDFEPGDVINAVPFVVLHYSVESVTVITPKGESIEMPRDDHFISYGEHCLFTYINCFINHSCAELSNCKPRLIFNESSKEDCQEPFFYSEIIATQHIKKSDEIRMNYGLFEYEAGQGFQCLCGSKNCVKHYRGYKHYDIEAQNSLLEENSGIAPEVTACLYFDGNKERKEYMQSRYINKLSANSAFLFYSYLSYLCNHYSPNPQPE